MIPIFLASVTPYVGKNVVAMGIAQKLRKEGKAIGYFKPIGPLPVHAEGVLTDEDASFFRKALNLSEPLQLICPIILNDEALTALLRGDKINARDRILNAFKTVSQAKDFTLVAGMGRLASGTSFGYPMSQFVRDVRAKVIAVERYHWPVETLDGLLEIKNLIGDHFAGVVFNRVPSSKANYIEQSVRPFLTEHGVDVLGTVPDDITLSATAVSDLVEALDGKVLCCTDKLDQLVERFSIGAMNADAALRFFQRVPNKAVITGGDRADIQLAALQTSTRCLILTGDLYPNERLLARAEELGVPVILVAHVTSAAAEICEHVQGGLSLHGEGKIARATELIEECLDWPTLHKSLGIK